MVIISVIRQCIMATWWLSLSDVQKVVLKPILDKHFDDPYKRINTYFSAYLAHFRPFKTNFVNI